MARSRSGSPMAIAPRKASIADVRASASPVSCHTAACARPRLNCHWPRCARLVPSVSDNALLSNRTTEAAAPGSPLPSACSVRCAPSAHRRQHLGARLGCPPVAGRLLHIGICGQLEQFLKLPPRFRCTAAAYALGADAERLIERRKVAIVPVQLGEETSEVAEQGVSERVGTRHGPHCDPVGVDRPAQHVYVGVVLVLPAQGSSEDGEPPDLVARPLLGDGPLGSATSAADLPGSCSTDGSIMSSAARVSGPGRPGRRAKILDGHGIGLTASRFSHGGPSLRRTIRRSDNDGQTRTDHIIKTRSDHYKGVLRR